MTKEELEKNNSHFPRTWKFYKFDFVRAKSNQFILGADKLLFTYDDILEFVENRIKERLHNFVLILMYCTNNNESNDMKFNVEFMSDYGIRVSVKDMITVEVDRYQYARIVQLKDNIESKQNYIDVVKGFNKESLEFLNYIGAQILKGFNYTLTKEEQEILDSVTII